jgi:acetylornithine/N-succinyldiaminopimelate aminotransferase
MKPFDVYPLYNIEPVKASGSWITDKTGQRYLDFYGGHAVISVGHSHPHYVRRLNAQLKNIAFYSNAVQNSLQEKLAEKLGVMSGYENYALFLCNSGAEANENALKLASFQNNRKKIVAFSGSFHGRTSAAVAATDDSSLIAALNAQHDIAILPFNNSAALETQLDETVCAVIIEGIQGVGGIQVPDHKFLQRLRELCDVHGIVLILDEVQSGYGRTGLFFAHQFAGIQPDLITIAKGMANGFPAGGVLIAPHFEARHGLLGTTFGGNHLACAAALAVLEIMETENLLENAQQMGDYLASRLKTMPGVKNVRGRGLMIGINTAANGAAIRKRLLDEHRIFTGFSGDKQTIRLLPALTIGQTEADFFLDAFSTVLQTKPVFA